VNLESAQVLNRPLHGFLPEQAIFRVDHFLAWPPFPTILSLRFANGIFEPLWDRNYIERVEIIWEETLALEGRAGYFDHAGIWVIEGLDLSKVEPGEHELICLPLKVEDGDGAPARAVLRR
jgi:Glucose-6-phosphate dehydrogenase, C-terminal domain